MSVGNERVSIMQVLISFLAMIVDLGIGIDRFLIDMNFFAVQTDDFSSHTNQFSTRMDRFPTRMPRRAIHVSRRTGFSRGETAIFLA